MALLYQKYNKMITNRNNLFTSMKFKTFIKIYYSHRLMKANFFKRTYINLLLPFIYLLNRFYYPKIKDLDLFALKHEHLYLKDLNFLFQFFNSDKGDFYINQYQKPAKKEKKLIDGHAYHSFYEKFFQKEKTKSLNILELGSFRGNAAAALFFYFKNAHISSGDIFPDLFTYKSKRIKNFLLIQVQSYKYEIKLPIKMKISILLLKMRATILKIKL